MALVIGFLPFTTRIMNGAVIQIHKELEEASYVSGVARLRTLVLNHPAVAHAGIPGGVDTGFCARYAGLLGATAAGRPWQRGTGYQDVFLLG